MILFPAIDLKNGECVRLVRGDMDQATVFNADPAAQARWSARLAGDRLRVGIVWAGNPARRVRERQQGARR